MGSSFSIVFGEDASCPFHRNVISGFQIEFPQVLFDGFQICSLQIHYVPYQHVKLSWSPETHDGSLSEVKKPGSLHYAVPSCSVVPRAFNSNLRVKHASIFHV